LQSSCKHSCHAILWMYSNCSSVSISLKPKRLCSAMATRWRRRIALIGVKSSVSRASKTKGSMQTEHICYSEPSCWLACFMLLTATNYVTTLQYMCFLVFLQNVPHRRRKNASRCRCEQTLIFWEACPYCLRCILGFPSNQVTRGK